MQIDQALGLAGELIPILNDEGITLGQLMRVAEKAAPILPKYGVPMPEAATRVVALLPVLANMAK